MTCFTKLIVNGDTVIKEKINEKKEEKKRKWFSSVHISLTKFGRPFN